MKTKLMALLLVAGGSLFAQHFGVGVAVGAPGYYGAPPPVAAGAYRPPCPGPGYLWINGYYDGYGSWVGGYWSLPPYAGANWVGPRFYGGQYYAGYWGGPRYVGPAYRGYVGGGYARGYVGSGYARGYAGGGYARGYVGGGYARGGYAHGYARGGGFRR